MRDILRGTRGSHHGATCSTGLLYRPAGGNVLGMFKLARLLQFVGLVIPPLAIVAQLTESILLGQMLQFLFVAVVLFTIGYLLQRYSGGG